jgi:hypothetical protein
LETVEQRHYELKPFRSLQKFTIAHPHLYDIR